jgi:hypothetical protein
MRIPAQRPSDDRPATSSNISEFSVLAPRATGHGSPGSVVNVGRARGTTSTLGRRRTPGEIAGISNHFCGLLRLIA